MGATDGDAPGSTDAVGVDGAADADDGNAGDPLLAVDDVVKAFGGLVAVDGATFDVERESITGLIGPNGAGKSTLFDCITGVHAPDGGTIRLDGEEIQGETPPAEAYLGTRKFYRKRTWVDARLFHMESLVPGNRIVGPAIIESDATTFVVPDGFETWLDDHRLFHLKEL